MSAVAFAEGVEGVDGFLVEEGAAVSLNALVELGGVRHLGAVFVQAELQLAAVGHGGAWFAEAPRELSATGAFQTLAAT